MKTAAFFLLLFHPSLLFFFSPPQASWVSSFSWAYKDLEISELLTASGTRSSRAGFWFGQYSGLFTTCFFKITFHDYKLNALFYS